MDMRPMLLLPEISIFLGGMAVLLGGSFLPRTRQWVSRLIAAIACLGAAIAGAVSLFGPAQQAMSGTFAIDDATAIARIIAPLGTLIVLALASDEIAGSPRESDTYALLLFSTAGTLILAGANDLLIVAVGFLLSSIPLYGLIGVSSTPNGAEATMKAYLIGALFGIVLLGGITVLYGVSGTTLYGPLARELAGAPPGAVGLGAASVVMALMFKVGGVPGHFWIPDAAQGAGGAVAAFLTTVPKVGALIAIYRVLEIMPATLAWPLLVALLAVVSMTLGNLAAFWQSDPRRLLGWSTVSQVGYLLVPLAVVTRSDLALPALLFYLAAYVLTNLGAFAVSTAFPELRDLEEFRGLGRERPWLGAALVVLLLSLVGTPPTAVFVGKLVTAAAAWDGGVAWLAIAVFVNSVVSLFYYVRWIAPVYRSGEARASHGMGQFLPTPWSSATAIASAVAVLVLGIGAGIAWPALS
ncbi:NADH-quinone oxidoreductase subunit N [Flaviflexus huanghaiensis]|uniref:NADH-quinone oxidoreductase subunit N n=1 Tax=Flaviflexus huanghaiensis TaxID=1111473 RepID=UPI0019D68A36|nr:NADH-quinone oxidoreductase subunit N [Flaviflexus huanghaiensis]